MKKRYTYAKKRATPKRRYKARRTTASKIGKRMQRQSYSFVQKKYTLVRPIECPAGSDSVALTISNIGGRNSVEPASTITLFDANPDNMLADQMRLYQFFKISGVAFKLFFPEGTSVGSTPVQWSMGYSSNQVIKPTVLFQRLQTLATYQTSSCSAKTPIGRFFRTRTTLKRLGIDWCNTDEFVNFGNAVTLYANQLAINAGSSTNLKIYRSSTDTIRPAQLARIQVTYYVTYKGAKGTGSLTQ